MTDGSSEKQNTKHRPNKIVKYLLIMVLLLAVGFAALVFGLSIYSEPLGYIGPDYAPAELEEVYGKKELTEEDYDLLYHQTGLGKSAIDRLRREGPLAYYRIAGYQAAFFSDLQYQCEKIGIITYEERFRDEEGKLIRNFQIADIREGDIFITKGTHSLGWRHGHAAIITDAYEGTTLEAVLWGQNTEYQGISKWRTYPSFIQLRLRTDLFESEEERDRTAAEIAKLAEDVMVEIPYGLLTGIPVKAPEPVKKTQCAHLIWYPYYQFGYDLDSDGFWLVTPNDIANSDLLEVVQIYGVDPDNIWP